MLTRVEEDEEELKDVEEIAEEAVTRMIIVEMGVFEASKGVLWANLARYGLDVGVEVEFDYAVGSERPGLLGESSAGSLKTRERYIICVCRLRERERMTNPRTGTKKTSSWDGVLRGKLW
jgi:hypothetical protein